MRYDEIGSIASSPEQGAPIRYDSGAPVAGPDMHAGASSDLDDDLDLDTMAVLGYD